jgi:xylan 1,4-beta-xylosidase
MKIKFLILLLIVAQAGKSQKQSQVNSLVNINMDKSNGIIRPLHGGNLGPVVPLEILDFSDFYVECKIPLVRLHDVAWYDNAVDISTIFKNFRDDPSDADNYDFRQTDDYIASIIKTGSKIIFRLGQSIEFTKRKYYVNPPADYAKWTTICKNIIRHYNEGWDNGFHYDIKYWEIWNEPDVQESEGKSWTGTNEQYFSLYEVAAKAIKTDFPDVKVGGPAVGGAVLTKDGKKVATTFVNDFLRYCTEKSIPLDFFSWHNYNSSPWELAGLCTDVRNILDQNGFTKTESILDEWNYLPGPWSEMSQQGPTKESWTAKLSSIKGGAFIADVLMLLQDEPIDQATLFTTINGGFGLFSDMGVKHKSAYAFEAFAEFANNNPLRIETQYNKTDSLVICTGTNKEKTELSILVSNFSSASKKIDLKLTNNFLAGPIKYEVYAVDKTHNLSRLREYEIEGKSILNINQNITGPSVFLLKLFSAKYRPSK